MTGQDLSTAFFGNYHVTLGQAGQHFCGTVGTIAGMFDPNVATCTPKIPASLVFDFDRQLRWNVSFPTYQPDRGADQVCVPGTAPCTAYTPLPLVTTTPLPPVR